jgi:hypothetical protein
MGLMMLAFLTTGWLDQAQKVRLEQGEPHDVLGYTMTFRGVEKPTPLARDAMVVEVEAPDGDSFVLKPRMWVNQKSNQLVANPDIKSFLTTDLYMAPVEYQPAERSPVSGQLMLTKGQPQNFRDWTLTFKGFDLSRQNAVPGAITVGVVVDIDRPGADMATVEPSMLSTNEGLQAVPVDVPGVAGAQIRATGMSVDQGLVRVELLGLGGGFARTEMLTTGESLSYEGMTITLSEFDIAESDAEAGRIDFGVVFQVEHDGQVHEVVPTFAQEGEGRPVVTPAVVPNAGGVALDLGRVDAENGRVELRVYDPTMQPPAAAPASLVIDVSTKPLIGLVWLGTLLVIAGIIIAIGLRGKDISSIPLEA